MLSVVVAKLMLLVLVRGLLPNYTFHGGFSDDSFLMFVRSRQRLGTSNATLTGTRQEFLRLCSRRYSLLWQLSWPKVNMKFFDMYKKPVDFFPHRLQASRVADGLLQEVLPN